MSSTTHHAVTAWRHEVSSHDCRLNIRRLHIFRSTAISAHRGFLLRSREPLAIRYKTWPVYGYNSMKLLEHANPDIVISRQTPFRSNCNCQDIPRSLTKNSSNYTMNELGGFQTGITVNRLHCNHGQPPMHIMYKNPATISSKLQFHTFELSTNSLSFSTHYLSSITVFSP